MSIITRLTNRTARPHLPRRTVRLRMTLVYGCLFLISGAALLTVTYILVRHSVVVPVKGSSFITVTFPAISDHAPRTPPRPKHATAPTQ